jgi:cytochrome c-type biogenesis protein CcmF
MAGMTEFSAGPLGRLSLLLALAVACFGMVVGLAAGRRGSQRALGWTYAATYGYAGLLLLANLSMVFALLTHDFSVSYVAQVGSRGTPPLYSVVSLWSSLEGSILFWGLVLGVYSACFARWHAHRDVAGIGYALSVQLFVAAFFALLLCTAANPFLPQFPVPQDGPGPNALLQNHLLMVIHPPMLYLGYVGMTVPFSVAIAALLRGSLSPAWLKLLRRTSLLPWLFLSVGIILGSWWAYEVLGWGGYWAWDPVENASFLPWLAATGYLHSTVMQERRKLMKAWTLAQVVAAFLLTILGTFMTRSGVFNSVHSFTQSAIGPIFLVFLGIVSFASILLLVLRSPLLENEGRIEAVWSRDTAFFLNNLLFVLMTFTVLLGTLFPLIAEAVTGVKVSVGEPYFDAMAMPIGLLMIFLMGVGPVLPWGQPMGRVVLRELMGPVVAGGGAALAAGLSMPAAGPLPLLSFGLCGFAGWVTVRELWTPAHLRARQVPGRYWRAFFTALLAQRRRTGGYLVHLAILLIAVAIAASQNYRQTAEASLGMGESLQLGTLSLTYLRTEEVKEPHRMGLVAHVRVEEAGKSLGIMMPRLNFYPSMREPVGTPHVVTLGSSDLYLSLMSVQPRGERIGLKAYRIPLVFWIWRSLPLLVLGSMISLWPRRTASGLAARLPQAAAAASP